MDRTKYSENWEEIALAVKEEAEWQCKMCGKQCRRPGEPFDTHKRTLTVAHCNHIEADCRPENLVAACALCHLKYDLDHHRQSAAKTRYRKKSKNQYLFWPTT